MLVSKKEKEVEKIEKSKKITEEMLQKTILASNTVSNKESKQSRKDSDNYISYNSKNKHGKDRYESAERQRFDNMYIYGNNYYFK